MKTRWMWLGGAVIVVGAVAGFAVDQIKRWEAEMLEWRLLNRIASSKVRESKDWGVFARRLEVSPKDVELGGRRYRIRDVWIEHRTGPQRLSRYVTQQEIYRDLILCVDVWPFDSQTDIWIKDARTKNILGTAVDTVLLSEVGVVPPSSFVLCTRDHRSEAVIQVLDEPNKAPEPTP